MARELFNIYYNRAHQGKKAFKTEILDEDTENEQRNDLWATPQLTLILEFDKSPENFITVNAFFDRHKGRKKAFDFYWDPAKGGDGKTYIMRFDTDELDFRIDDLKYKHFTLKIKTTVDDE